MSKKPERYVMVETQSDNLFKFDHKPKDNLLIDFPNGVIIGVLNGLPNVACYLPD